MNETWTEEPIGPRLYGSSTFGSFYFGSTEFTDETPTTVTWSVQTTGSTTWTEQ